MNDQDTINEIQITLANCEAALAFAEVRNAELTENNVSLMRALGIMAAIAGMLGVLCVGLAIR